MTSYRLSLQSGWQNIGKNAASNTVRNIATAVRSQAVMNAPILTGALRQSAKSEKISDTHYRVSFNTAYARRRHFENYKHPGTLYYLQRAGESVGARYSSYVERVS